MTGRLMTLSEVAAALGVSETRLYRLLSSNPQIETTTLRGRIAVSESAVVLLREAMDL